MKQAFTNDDILLIKSKIRKYVLLYVLITIVFLVLTVVLFLSSKRDFYIVQLIINIVLTIAYGWYTIYFFTIPYKGLVQLNKTYVSIATSEELEEELTLEEIVNDYQKERSLITLLKLRNKEGNERILYLLKPIELKKGKKYIFISKANYVLSYEEIK